MICYSSLGDTCNLQLPKFLRIFGLKNLKIDYHSSDILFRPYLKFWCSVKSITWGLVHNLIRFLFFCTQHFQISLDQSSAVSCMLWLYGLAHSLLSASNKRVSCFIWLYVVCIHSTTLFYLDHSSRSYLHLYRGWPLTEYPISVYLREKYKCCLWPCDDFTTFYIYPVRTSPIVIAHLIIFQSSSLFFSLIFFVFRSIREFR